jgi:hypothetical protein
MKAVRTSVVRQAAQKMPVILYCLAVLPGLLGGAWGGTAHGHVLQGPQILSLMSDNIRGFKTLRVDQRVTVEDSTVSTDPISFQETLNYIFPDHFRSDIVHQTTRRIHVASRGQALTVEGNAILPDAKGHYDQYKDLLLFNSAYLLQKTLYNHHIDVGITSLGRLDDKVVFVIGARYPDESVSQVWVDQEQFVPLRWLNVQKDGEADLEERWDFLYSHWQKVDGGRYPFKIETFHNQQLIRRIEVIKADDKAVIDDELFNIARLRSVHERQDAPPDGEPPPPSDIEEVQRTIEEFKRKFEP